VWEAERVRAISAYSFHSRIISGIKKPAKWLTGEENGRQSKNFVLLQVKMVWKKDG